jgi:hypothetical protein
VLNADTLIDENLNNISATSEIGRFSTFLNLNAGKYRFMIPVPFNYDNYPDVAF